MKGNKTPKSKIWWFEKELDFELLDFSKILEKKEEEEKNEENEENLSIFYIFF